MTVNILRELIDPYIYTTSYELPNRLTNHYNNYNKYNQLQLRAQLQLATDNLCHPQTQAD